MPAAEQKRLGYLDVTAGVLLLIVQAFKWPVNSKRRFIVKENPLPEDAELQSVELIEPDVVRLWITSAHISEGDEIPAPVLFITN